MVFKLLAEFFHECDDRHCRCVAKRTKSAAKHVLSQVLNVIDILLQSRPCMEPSQSFFQPVSSFTAGNAPATTFVLVELDGAEGELHDAGSVIENDNAAGA